MTRTIGSTSFGTSLEVNITGRLYNGCNRIGFRRAVGLDRAVLVNGWK